METALIEMLKNSPVAIVLFWMVSVFNKKDDQKNAQIAELHNKLTGVIENNTKVMTTVNSSIVENTKATETLSVRIYDVLTNKHGQRTNI
jgi:hypothetical protein